MVDADRLGDCGCVGGLGGWAGGLVSLGGLTMASGLLSVLVRQVGKSVYSNPRYRPAESIVVL